MAFDTLITMHVVSLRNAVVPHENAGQVLHKGWDKVKSVVTSGGVGLEVRQDPTDLSFIVEQVGPFRVWGSGPGNLRRILRNCSPIVDNVHPPSTTPSMLQHKPVQFKTPNPRTQTLNPNHEPLNPKKTLHTGR
jgi:hypothetical protein